MVGPNDVLRPLLVAQADPNRRRADGQTPAQAPAGHSIRLRPTAGLCLPTSREAQSRLDTPDHIQPCRLQHQNKIKLWRINVHAFVHCYHGAMKRMPCIEGHLILLSPPPPSGDFWPIAFDRIRLRPVVPDSRPKIERGHRCLPLCS